METPIAIRLPFRGASVLLLGSTGSYALSFVRNLILARLLTKADFGTAALFSNTLSMFEFASRMSFGQQIVQSQEGGSRAFRDSAHGFQLALCLAGSGVILAFSLVGAQLVVGEAAGWAIASLAAVPLAKGFENLDVFREQRRFNQLPAVLCEFVPQLIITIATWPLAVWLGDFRVVLWILIAKPVLGLLTSHLVASEPYGLAWRPQYLRAMAKFGWPLVLNGILIFVSQQADQFLIAGLLSTEELAAYALAVFVVSVPWALFAQPGLSLALPVLSSLQDQPVHFRQHYRACVELTSVVAMALTLPLIIFGEQFVTILYGHKYAGAGGLVTVLGVATAVRFVRFMPAVASMALADTRNQLNSNIVRAMSLPVAALVLGAGWRTNAVAIVALFAEIAAGLVSSLRLAKREGIPLRDFQTSALFVVASLALAATVSLLGAHTWNWWLAAFGVTLTPLLVFSAAWFTFPETVRPIAKMLLGK